MTSTCGHIRDADGPGFRCDPWPEREEIVRRWNADECDLARIGRPHGLAVMVDTWINITQVLSCGIEDADKGVISTAADKGEFRTVGRPSQRLRGSASVHGLFGLVVTIERRPPDLSLVEKRDAVTLGRNCGVMSFAEFAGVAAVESNGPQRLIDALRIAARIRELLAPCRSRRRERTRSTGRQVPSAIG